MSQSPKSNTPPASSPNAPQDAAQRHWMYGFNAGLLVVIGLVVVLFLFYFGDRSKGSAWASFDWTSSGANSLSDSTKRLLREIGERKQKYKLYNLYPSRSDVEKRENRNPEQDEHRRRVLDLLNEYARRSPNITVEDLGDRPTEDIQNQIRDLYQKELQPYEEVVTDFDALSKKVSTFLEDQAAKVGAAGQKNNGSRSDLEMAASLQLTFQMVPDDLESVRRVLKDERAKRLPRWGRMKEVLVSGLTEGDRSLVTLLGILSDKEKVKALPKIPASLVEYFTEHNSEYKAIYDELVAYRDRLNKLPPLKVDDVLESVQRNRVAILGTDSAKVISDFEIFAPVPSPGGNGMAGISFNGEQLISSALLSMVRPEKVKVVFVGLSAQGGSQFTDIKEMLKAENFETLEWAPPARTPAGAPPDSDPPAQGKGVVWVVFPPEPDPQMAAMGMAIPGDAGPIIAAAKQHLAAGGQAMFMAETSGAPNPMMGQSGPSEYPYEELVREFGVTVKSKFTVVNAQQMMDRETGREVSQATPYVQFDRFEDHEITRPIQSLPTVFGPIRTPASWVTVVDTAPSPPSGVEAKVIVRSPPGGEFFATASPFSSEVKFKKETDLYSPVPMAAVGLKNKGQKDKEGTSAEQRVAVFGSKLFPADFFLEYPQRYDVGGQSYIGPRFPGNGELFKNTVLWLAGYENMIAVSAKANQGARIKNVPPGQLKAVRVLVAGGVPVAALLIGGIVWKIRRR